MAANSESVHSPDLRANGFEEIEHTADLALHVYGRDLEAFFRHAARGLTHLINARPLVPPFDCANQFELTATDIETLLVDWLAEIAYLAETELLLFGDFEIIHITPSRLTATARGRKVKKVDKMIKAVTYHNLKIINSSNGFSATVVFDV